MLPRRWRGFLDPSPVIAVAAYQLPLAGQVSCRMPPENLISIRLVTSPKRIRTSMVGRFFLGAPVRLGVYPEPKPGRLGHTLPVRKAPFPLVNHA